MKIFQEFVLRRTYTRRGENSWADVVNRVCRGIKHWLKNTPLRGTWLANLLDKKAFDYIITRKMLPPGRGLWMMGTKYISQRGSKALNNCGFVSTRPPSGVSVPEAIAWIMDSLMLGVGVGFDVAGKDTIVQGPQGKVRHHISDSRTGWVLSVKALLEAYLCGAPYPMFNYSRIRPAGAEIKGFGGIASGPGPLKRLHREIDEICTARLGQPIGVEGIVEIVNAIGRCVVAGNVRRSALLALSPPDQEFYRLKAEKERIVKKMWVSNISVKVSDPKQIYEFKDYFLKNGEPGLYNERTINLYGRTGEYAPQNVEGINPCGEIALESFELCNLAEVYPANCDSLEEFKEAIILAYAYAKMVSLLKVGDPYSQRVVSKNHRLGVSVSGLQEAYVKFGKDIVLDTLDKMYLELRRLDDQLYALYDIPKSIRLTTIKPSGTTSIIAGVSPGVHYPFAKYYVRRVRLGINDKLVPQLERANVPLIEDEYSSDTLVAEFPLAAPEGVPTLDSVDFKTQLKNVLELQRVWADNQISCTLYFSEDERDIVPELIADTFDEWKTLTVMPRTTDHYPLMPLEKITYKEYAARVSAIEPDVADFSGIIGVGEHYCTGDRCLI